MKQCFVALSGLAWLGFASAACCRSNQCLKAIVQIAENGVEDCSSLLAVTVTNAQSTFTETSTVVPTEFNTIVDTAVVTEIETSVASTETRIVTVSVTVTPTTRTDVVTEIETATETATNLETTTITSAAVTIIMRAPDKRGDTLLSPDPVQSTSAAQDVPDLPEYASTVCPSWERYTSACKCAGAVATTVTVDAPIATVTEEVTRAVTSPVLSTFLTTSTEVVSVTVTISDTETETALVTASTATTKTEQVTATTTVTKTTTETVSPSPPAPTCTVRAGAAFKAVATEYNNQQRFVYADVVSGVVGGLYWQLGTTSTVQQIVNKYIWALDADGYLGLAYNIPPYNYVYSAYTSTNNDPSKWPLVSIKSNVDVGAQGGTLAKITGCVDTVTGELILNGGKTNLLWCGTGTQLWLSTGMGEELNRGTCTLMHPKVQWM